MFFLAGGLPLRLDLRLGELDPAVERVLDRLEVVRPAMRSTVLATATNFGVSWGVSPRWNGSRLAATPRLPLEQSLVGDGVEYLPSDQRFCEPLG